MPRFDGTGPVGSGPMTGRGLGSCSGGMRKGLRGRGMGYGMMMNGCPWYGPMAKPTVQEEQEILKEQIELMKENLHEAEKRFAEIEKK